MNVTENVMLEWYRGRKMFCDGEPCPPQPPEEEFEGVCTPDAARWLGWRVAFGLQMIRDIEVKRYCEEGGPLPR